MVSADALKPAVEKLLALGKNKNANQPVYLDPASPDAAFCRVAHSEASALLNAALIQMQSNAAAGEPEHGDLAEDAFGERAELQEKFLPAQKLPNSAM
ncbi:MAG: hypothetical protein O2960_17790 [Verrucomicrobia bacterium]|nr:hypothetical protein [Verrucomicrobiota bacterium]